MRFVPALVLLCGFAACALAGGHGAGDEEKEAGHDHAFPPIRNTQPDGAEPNTPQQAAEAFTAPEGFEVTLFAGEPDVAQPIAMTFDDRGRLWVAECFTYTSRQFDVDHGDRVTIFEDTDGDGAHDKRTVFWDRGFMLTGLEYGFGGLWILNDGTLSFLPDENRDDVPDGEPGTEPVVMLDGFTHDAGHNVVNGLAWGPDGWLYGRHGITATSAVGVPGTPEANRTLLNCGIWRFHPTRHTFEVVATGTTNPWGLDWNEYGDAFFTNNVIGHAWHLIPGAHYRRMFGQDFNPHLYGLIDQHADHYHWDADGSDWTASRAGTDGANPTADSLGGGHSHCGGMIYQGDNWPEEYRGDLYMCNTHGKRINRDRPVPHGSGYKITHQPDFAFANSPWFKGVELKSGPDGGVFLLDWTDLGECHDHDGVHRTSGRIYKITHGKPERAGEKVDLAALTTEELFTLASTHPNVWQRRHATRLIIEEGRPDELEALIRARWYAQGGNALAWRPASVGEAREAIWAAETLVATATVDRPVRTFDPEVNKILPARWEEFYVRFWGRMFDARLHLPPNAAQELRHATEVTMAAAIRTQAAMLRQIPDQCAFDDTSEFAPAMTFPGRNDPPVARLAAISELARSGCGTPAGDRLCSPEVWLQRLGPMIEKDDAGDHNLMLMAWYAAEPAIAIEYLTWSHMVDRVIENCPPALMEFTIRRVASIADAPLSDPADPRAAKLKSAASGRLYAWLFGAAEGRVRFATDEQSIRAFRRALVRGVLAAYEGRRSVSPPPGWDRVAQKFSQSEDPEVRDLTRKLAVIFGDGAALEELRGVVTDRSASDAARVAAIDSLAEARDEAVAPVLIDLLKRQRGEDRNVLAAAARGLGAFESDEAAAVLLNALPRVRLEDRDAVLATLVSRPSYAEKLAEALPSLGVTEIGLSAEHVRALRAFKDPEIDAVLDEEWGTTRATPEEKLAEIEAWKEKLKAAGEPDLVAGREAYKNVCGRCHKLYGEGGDLGPNLTGSDRHNLDYLLGNVFDPSAIVPAAWRVSTVLLADGRVLTGVVSESNDRTLTLATADATVTLPAGDVLEIEAGDASLMPEGLFKTLTEEQVRDLIGYLRTESAPR